MSVSESMCVTPPIHVSVSMNLYPLTKRISVLLSLGLRHIKLHILLVLSQHVITTVVLTEAGQRVRVTLV